MFDVVIIGGGPAGSTLARLLRKDYKILIAERHIDPKKCCGGLIAPDAQKILACFDIGIPKKIIVDPQLFYVRSIDMDTMRERLYQRHYLNINRDELDKWSLESLGSNVVIKKGCYYITHIEEKEHIKVKIQDQNGINEIKCKILVGADGAYSKVRQSLYNDFAERTKYIAIQGIFEKINDINHYGAFFSKNITDFYSWLIPKDSYLVIGGAFKTNENPKAKYNNLKKICYKMIVFFVLDGKNTMRYSEPENLKLKTKRYSRLLQGILNLY